MPFERRAWVAVARLGLVLAAVAVAVVWWAATRAPDAVTDVVVRLTPSNSVQRLRGVPLTGGVYDPWRLQLRQQARFTVTVPGPDPVLRFLEATLEGRPKLIVRVVGRDGKRRTVWEQAATEAVWTLRRVPLPLAAGETAEIVLEAVDGGSRMNLGAVYLAEVVLESAGRPVDRSAVPVRSRAVSRDLLAEHGVKRQAAPPTRLGRELGLDGPSCLPLQDGETVFFDVPGSPTEGQLEVVLHVARVDVEATCGSGVVRVVDVRRGTLAEVSLDFASGQGHEHDVREVLLSVDLRPWAGRTAEIGLQREGGANLFVGLRDLIVTGGRSVPRRSFDPEMGLNVLLILVEGLRADRVGVFGDIYAVTPVMDGLAARGGRYTRVYAPSSWGMPNVASLLTGLEPATHGLGLGAGRRLSPRVVTLARSAAWGGVSTAAISASQDFSPNVGLDLGYEHFDAMVGSAANTVVDHALDWLANQRAFEWFLTVHLEDPVYPHQLIDEPGHEGPFEVDPALVGWLRELDSRPGAAEALAQEVGALYGAEVARVDYAIGRLLDWLDREKLLERTVVMVVGTAGEELFDHGGRRNGTSLWDEQVAVPMIVAGPGVKRGPWVEDAPTSLVDITRLLGHLGRLTAGAAMQGRLPEPFGAHPGVEAAVCSLLVPRVGTQGPWLHSVRTADWMLLEDQRSGRRSLFDLKADPQALHDLADRDDAPTRLARDTLAAVLSDWLAAGLRDSVARPVPLERLPVGGTRGR